MNEVLVVALLGVGLGAMYTLTAQGLILIYRGSGVLNFAHGAVAVSATYFWWELYVNHGWDYGFAVAAAIAAAMIFGALIHVLLMRPLRHASPLARTVATLGLLLTLESVIVLRYGTDTTIVPSKLPTTLTTIFGVQVSEDRLILLAIAIIMSAALWALYRFTSFGRATSAVAENQEAAATLGLSPDVIAASNWALGSGLAALAGILVAPILALQVSFITTLMLASLAAALVAKLRSFSVVLIASLALGITQSEIIRWVTSSNLAGLSASVPFLVIIVVMAVRGQAIPLRDFLLERLPAVGTGRVRPLWVLCGTVVAVVLVALLSASWANALAATFAFAAFMLAFVVLVGYTGQVSLAQWGLAGFGAWVAGRLIDSAGVPLPLGVLIGVLATVPVGLALALPALRTRGINLAIATLGFGTALEVMIFDNPSLTGGYLGTDVNLKAFGWNFNESSHPARYAYVTLACFVGVALIVANVRRGIVGRRMLAVRTNERAATALGINVRSVKLHSFGLAAAIAALGGILVSFGVGTVDYTQFSAFASVQYAALAFFGGIGYILGPIQGALLSPGTAGSQLGDDIVPGLDKYLGLIGGIGLILIILLNQDGVAAQMDHQRKWIAARLPNLGIRLRIPTIPRIRRSQPPLSAADNASGVEASTRIVPKTLTVTDITVRYGNVVALDSVSLTVQPGRVTGLIGPNGAGKTTLLDAVTGFARLAGGRVLLDGEDLAAVSAVQRARAGIVRSFQSLELFEDMTVLENIHAAADSRHWRYYATDLLRPTTSRLGPRLAAVVREFQLEDHLDSPANALPYGRRRLLAIARAVAANPSVLLLDEPAAGLSGQELRELAAVVRRLARDWGMAILLIEHDIEFVLETCDELEVIDFGKTISSGSPEVVRNDEAVIAAYLGTTDTTPAIAVEVS